MSLENMLAAWAQVAYALWPTELAEDSASRVYFHAIDRRADTDLEVEADGAGPFAELPYIEILAFDEAEEPVGLQAFRRVSPRVEVTGSWATLREQVDRTLGVHDIKVRARALRDAIDARMLAHARRSNIIPGVGAVSLISWGLSSRPCTDAVSGVDEFRLVATFTLFEEYP